MRGSPLSSGWKVVASARPWRTQTGQPSTLASTSTPFPTDSTQALGRRYGATFLVTRAPHPFPLRFRAGAVRVYALPAGDSLSPLPPSP